MGNSTCPVHAAPIDPKPFYSNGELSFKAHQVGWLVSGIMALVSTIASIWLVNKHLIYYTNKRQQRHIIRLLFMVPIYSIVSWLSYIDYKDAIYYELIRDCYEAFVIASFFALLLAYVGGSDAEIRSVMRYKEMDKWMWPFGWVKWRPSTGLYLLQFLKWNIMQYVVIRPLSTLAAVITQYFGLYCVASWGLGWSHIWLTTAISISVSIAMYFVLQLHAIIHLELQPYAPIAKFFCVKGVIFLTFWQASGLSLLASYGVIPDTQYMTSEDILVGLNALLLTFEMMIFAFIHIKAFTYRPYRLEDHSIKTSRWKSISHAFDFRDIGHELSQGSVYMAKKLRGLEPDGPDREKDLQALTGHRRGRVATHPTPASAAELARQQAGSDLEANRHQRRPLEEEEEEVERVEDLLLSQHHPLSLALTPPKDHVLNYLEFDPDIDEDLHHRLAYTPAASPPSSVRGRPKPSRLASSTHLSAYQDRRELTPDTETQEGRWWRRWVPTSPPGLGPRSYGSDDDRLSPAPRPVRSLRGLRGVGWGSYREVGREDNFSPQEERVAAGGIPHPNHHNHHHHPAASYSHFPVLSRTSPPQQLYQDVARLQPPSSQYGFPAPSPSVARSVPLSPPEPTRPRPPIDGYFAMPSPLERLSSTYQSPGQSVTSCTSSDCGTFGGARALSQSRPAAQAIKEPLAVPIPVSSPSAESFRTALSRSPTQDYTIQEPPPHLARVDPTAQPTSRADKRLTFGDGPGPSQGPESTRSVSNASSAMVWSPRQIVMPTPLSPARYPGNLTAFGATASFPMGPNAPRHAGQTSGGAQRSC